MHPIEILRSLRMSARSVEFLPGGYNSDVTAVVDNGVKKVVKIIGGKKEPMSEHEARCLAADLIAYHEALTATGLRIPELEAVKLFENRVRAGFEVVEVCAFRGYAVDRELRESSRQAPELFREISTAMLPVLCRRISNGDLDIGIDPKPENFTRERKNLWFVDTMPPRYRKGGVVLVEYPAPKTRIGQRIGYLRHFTLSGVFTVLRTQLGRLCPRLYERITRIADHFVSTNFPDEAIRDRAVEEIVTRQRIRSVNQCTSADVYVLREVACHLASKSSALGKHWLGQIFDLTHFEDGVSDASLARAKHLIAEALRERH